MRIFVTGGSGFLGRHLLPRLSAEGHEVTALARSEGSAAAVRALGAEPLAGSLEDLAQWEDRLHGHDVVVHCAAPVEFWGPWERFYREITLATRALLRAAEHAGVPRFVYISSESVLQDAAPLLDVDESQPYPEEPNSYYGKAKKLAEVEVQDGEHPIERVILRPPFIWGKGVAALDQMVQKVRAGQFVWVDQGRAVMEMVHVANVVQAIVLALARGSGIYFVTDGEPATVREFLSALLATRGVEPPGRSIPGFVARLAAAGAEGAWKAAGLGRPPPLTRFEWAFVAMPRRYDIRRIRSELGYEPIMGRAQGLAEMSG